ncbi:conjugative transposon protein TraM [Dyadobacter alkalitolerans]|uniref:conjugative transposon protein TraM n=1 Tax=Dyadobacter alkalitolerans TaxID=492736 RepID=UPI00047C067B|nr:conjugative transposon protein TraM [Dyadobacter alkalitolerans]
MSDLNNQDSNQQNIDLDSKKKKQGQMLLIMVCAIILLAGGIVFFTNSIGKSDAAEGDTDLENIMPLEAKNKSKDEKSKYGRDYKRKLADESYDSGISDLTGEPDQYKRRSNEHLTEKDYEEVRQAGNVGTPVRTPKRKTNSKEQMNKENQRRIAAARRQIAYDANPDTPLFKKSPEEIREEKLAELERQNNAEMTKAVLAGLDKASNAQNGQPGITAASDPMAGMPQKKAYPGQPKVATNSLQPATNENTIAKATSTGFYSESRSLEAETMNQYSYIPAVVHGNGDGIKVQNGTSVKLRLLASTYINIGGTKTVLPRNSLLNGTIRISKDRVNIVISSVRLNNNVVPVKMIAYDIDGVQGLYIPNLMDKNLLGRELAEAGSRPLQGSVWTQGSMRNQIGTQVATDVARTLVQGGSQFARRKMQIVRVTIKPNYKVLLTAGELENTEDTESILNY